MDLRFYLDPDTQQPHVLNHGVTEQEVQEAMIGRGEDIAGNRGSRQKLGQTSSGRYLKIVYVPDADPQSAFVITAYELRGKAKKAFRRRQRKKGK